MRAEELNATLEEMARAHRELLARTRVTDGGSPRDVLDLGAASLSNEVAGIFELNRFLDDAVVEELLAERRSLAADLDLLKSLLDSSSSSPDVLPLATAVLRRIERLLEREERGLYLPLLRITDSET